MDTKEKNGARIEPPRYRVRVPGFTGEEVGLGDVIARATRAVAIRPCGGCARRAASLNQLVRFSPGARRK